MDYIVLLLVLLSVDQSLSNQTELLAPRNDLLSRRVRALIFPKQASILITAALTKVIVGGRPGGLQYSLEFDMYVPLPDSLEGWRPNLLIGPTIKPKSTWDGHWTTKPKTHKQSFYQSPWQLTEQPWQRHYNGKKESWNELPSWKLNRGYRERREIFDQLEAMGNFFQMDFRSCIKRTMCELQSRFSEHYGRNLLMEDLMRIVLTVPEDIADDKYRHRLTGKDCARFYAVSCPYSVLEFLTQKT